VPLAIAILSSIVVAVAETTEKTGGLFLECGLDRSANVHPQTLLDRIEPGLMDQ